MFFHSVLVTLLIFLSGISYAQDLSGYGCKKLKESDKCGQCDPEVRNDVLASLKKVENSRITSIEDFLEILPDSMKKDFIMMSDSRSFQTSDTLNPRVLMRSANSDVVMSFNSHHAQAEGKDFRGNDRVEMMMWNGETARFDFIDVQFPSEEKGGKAKTKPIITKNPQTCLNCHGGENPRPNWDPYNFWAGQIPFNRDTLVRGSQEAKDYIEILKRMEGKSIIKNKRLEKLKGLISSSDLENALAVSSTFQLPTINSKAGSNSDGPGVSMFDQLSAKNFCRIGHALNDHKDKNKFKYALLAAKNRCENLQSFIPEALRSQFDNFFSKRNQGLNDSKQFSLAKLTNETSIRQQSVFADKKARQLWAMEKEYAMRAKELKLDNLGMTPRQYAQSQLDMMKTFRPTENRESQGNSSVIANIRYILEPLGINVDSWSMSIDPGTYSFADVISNLQSFGLYADSQDNYKTCTELKKLSHDAFEADLPRTSQSILERTCTDNFSLEPLTPSSTNEIVAVLDEGLRKGMENLLTKNGCIGCHDNGVNGAPKVPFSNLKQLESDIKRTKGDENGGMALAIWNRINRPEGSSGQMPMGMPILSKEDQTLIRTYLNSVKLQKD